jgi:Tol biopolymer transport system component
MKRQPLWLVAAAVFALPMGACNRDEVTAVPGISASRSDGPNTLYGVIAFVTDPVNGSPGQIAIMHPDGTGRRMITSGGNGSIMPAISPDGRRIAFTRFGLEGPEGLFLMNGDGSAQTLLVHLSPLFDGEAAWSPDGSRIAFQSLVDGPFGAFGRIFIINVDGTGLRQVTPDVGPDDYQYDDGPSWSPDGTRIVFTRSGVLYLINADGTGLTPFPEEDLASNPSWSPDGSRIAYQASDGPGDIRVRNVDGSNPVTVTNTPEQQGWPRWSPDGRRLVFNRVAAGRFQLFVINADGTGETRLSLSGNSDGEPDWSPFPSARGGAGASIEIAPTDAKLAPSDSRQFTATVRLPNGNVVDHPPVTWSSSGPGVATVTSSGLVTALDNGLVEIQAVFGSDTARAQVRVADRVLRNVIVYSTTEFGYPALAAVKPDGTGRRLLTLDAFGYPSPDISPDGRRIAFSTDFSVFVIDADAVGITDGFTHLFFGFDAHVGAPAWSPDGSQVAFRATVQGPGGLAARILVVNADGSGRHQVTPDDADPNALTSDDAPSWSPDGSKIVFTRDGVLQVINADGTGLTPLPNEDGARAPSWSPDGSRVAYARLSGAGDIVVRNADGSNPVVLTSNPDQENNPRWSPDSRRLVFCRTVGGHQQLFVINADGTGEVKLSANPNVDECTAVWSPLP